MKAFIMTFRAKKRGAIGVSEQFTRTILAYDLHTARLRLYEEFDHIRMIKVIETGENEEIKK